jgi:hypothetical protein
MGDMKGFGDRQLEALSGCSHSLHPKATMVLLERLARTLECFGYHR